MRRFLAVTVHLDKPAFGLSFRENAVKFFRKSNFARPPTLSHFLFKAALDKSPATANFSA
jgi:hypothetical protein